jgi:hypothetical protein
MRLSQKASHPRAGGIAHRSARSQEFAGGARAPEEINARAYAGHALFREAYKRKKAPPLGSPELKLLRTAFLLVSPSSFEFSSPLVTIRRVCRRHGLRDDPLAQLTQALSKSSFRGVAWLCVNKIKKRISHSTLSGENPGDS